PRTPGRAHQAAPDHRARQGRGAEPAGHRSDHCQLARPRARLSRHALDRDLPSSLPAAQPHRQGQSLGRPVLRGAHHESVETGRQHPQLIVVGSNRENLMKRFLAMAFLLVISFGLAGCGYNTLQTRDEQIKAAWAEVLNQYQRRADLVPNLVNTVKGYAAHEQQVLTEVTNARANVGAIRATPELVNDPEAFAKFVQAQNQLQ